MPAGLDRSGQREALESERRTSVGLPTRAEVDWYRSAVYCFGSDKAYAGVAFTVSLTINWSAQ